MENKTYKTQAILRDFGKYNINLLIETESKNFEIMFNKYVIPHLLGLQYMGEKKLKGYECLRIMKRYNLSDQKILDMVESRDTSKYKNQRYSVERRINTFEYFMKNLEKGILVEKDSKRGIDVNYFLIQNNENEIMHLGIISSDNGALLVEYDTLCKEEKVILKTYFSRYDNSYYIGTKILEKVQTIKSYDEQKEKYLPFSFDKEKQAKLDKIEKIAPNYDYNSALNKAIEEIKNILKS